MRSLRIAVLGPLEATIDGAVVDLGSRKQRAVLGVLTALAPAAVPVERLVDEIWGEAGPANPLRSLQVYVSSLRTALGEYGDRLVTEGRAYRLLTDDVEVDAERFSRLAARGGRGAGRGPCGRADRRGARPLARRGVAGPP